MNHKGVIRPCPGGMMSRIDSIIQDRLESIIQDGSVRD